MPIVLLAATTVTVGCLGSAQIYYQDQTQGVLVLDGDEDKAVESAHKRMAQHCGPGNYRIVKRETVVVGRERYAASSTDHSESEKRRLATASSGDARRERTSEYADSVAARDSTTTDVGPGYADSDSVSTLDAAGGEHEVERERHRETSDEAERRALDASTSTQSVAGTRDVREHRLHYRCGG